jgi:hypothetical protein
MRIRPMRLFLTPIFGLLCGQILFAAQPADSSPASPAKSALLIGIDTYEHPATDIKVPAGAPLTGRFEPALLYQSLKGPSNDVAAMRNLLTSAKFGFPNDAQHIHVLLNGQATHDAILQAMEQYVVKDPKPGDTVVVYVSSHGSLRAAPKGHGAIYNIGGSDHTPTYLENTIVPYDWYLGKDDIFSRDLRHIFNQAADRNIHVTAIFDSCHSGSLARGLGNPGLVPRSFDIDPRPMPDDPYPAEAKATAPENRPDNPVLVLSAAQKDQSAIDVQDSDPPHGLFTNALVETLQALPANRSALDIFKRLEVAMELAPGATNQQPELDTSIARRHQPLFGGAAGSGPPTAAVVSTEGSSVLLDIGTAADIGPGSEFTTVTESNGVRAVMKVSESLGLARCRATIVSSAGGVHAKDVVELTKWVPAERPTLKFYLGSDNLSAAEIEKAFSALRSAQIHFVNDPSRDPWTHHILWDGVHWMVYAHSEKTPTGQVKKEKPFGLDSKLSPPALKKIPPGSNVWFDAPLPKESVQALLAPPPVGAPPNAAVFSPDRTQAMYVIAGNATDAGISYAWFKRSDMDAEVQTLPGNGAGCSPNSSYPLRTDWVVPGKVVPPEVALAASAVQLARLNGWLQLGSSALTGQADFPYRFVLQRVSKNEDIADGGSTHVNGVYQPTLLGNMKASVAPRWVYVLSIDCQGKGVLLWPGEGAPAGKFPMDEGKLDRITLPGQPFAVADPLGTDTYLMLTTTTPLANPDLLEFTGVVTRGAKATSSADPLEDLLDSTSAGTRGVRRPTPTNWSVQMLQTQSLAQ